MAERTSGGIRELVPIFFVAIAVTLAGTLAGSVLDHTHQVDAEQLHANELPAVAASPGWQALTIKAWGVGLKLPLATEMPLLSYANQSSGAVGLSSADLERLGPRCRASRNALGVLLRLPAGTYANYPRGDLNTQFIKTIGRYDYAYAAPASPCLDLAATADIVNRERTVLYGALDSLAPLE